MTETNCSRSDRARRHRALGDERRLRIVDALQLSDRRVGELAAMTGLSTSLLAFHLDALEQAGVIARSVSEGDARRRYVTLQADALSPWGAPPAPVRGLERVLFVCTGNAARSPLAARLWRSRTGAPALSAGTEPAERIHPEAVAVARRHGLDLADHTPVHYRDLGVEPHLVISVCDHANESDLALSAPRLHWSIPDPAPAGRAAFEGAFSRLTDRIDRLARAA